MPTYNAPTGAPVWFDLVSSDPARATDFYGQLFGWEATEPTAEFGGYQNFSANGKLVAGLMPRMDPQAPTDVWSVYFRSDDIVADVEKASANGAQVIAPPMAVGDLGQMAVLVDPAGAVYGHWQPGTHAGFTERGVPGTPYWFDEMSMDYDATRDFYSKTLGWKLNEVGDPNSDGPQQYSEVFPAGSDESVAGLMGAKGMFGDDHPSFWQVYITVDDVAATLDTVSKLGGEVLMPADVTPWGTLASFKDPMGAAICLGKPPAGM